MEKNITINSDDMTSYMEDEIHNILSNITQEEYKSLKDIRERKHEAIEAIFYKFRHYEKSICVEFLKKFKTIIFKFNAIKVDKICSNNSIFSKTVKKNIYYLNKPKNFKFNILYSELVI